MTLLKLDLEVIDRGIQKFEIAETFSSGLNETTATSWRSHMAGTMDSM